MPFRYLQMVADELRCTVMEANDCDPEWRQYAMLKIQAEYQSTERKKQGSATAK